MYIHHYRRKCPNCGYPMGFSADIIFDGAKSASGGVGYPPVGYRLDSCDKCGSQHLKLFNPPGIRGNEGGFNALQNIADVDFIELYRDVIAAGGRLPRVHYITPEAHRKLMRLFVERVNRINSLSGYQESSDDYKEFSKYL